MNWNLFETVVFIIVVVIFIIIINNNIVVRLVAIYTDFLCFMIHEDKREWRVTSRHLQRISWSNNTSKNNYVMK